MSDFGFELRLVEAVWGSNFKGVEGRLGVPSSCGGIWSEVPVGKKSLESRIQWGGTVRGFRIQIGTDFWVLGSCRGS